MTFRSLLSVKFYAANYTKGQTRLNGKAIPLTKTRSSKQNSAADDLKHLNVDGNKAEAKKVLLNSLESILESVQLSDAHRLQKKVRKFAASLETPAVGAPSQESLLQRVPTGASAPPRRTDQVGT